MTGGGAAWAIHDATKTVQEQLPTGVGLGDLLDPAR